MGEGAGVGTAVGGGVTRAGSGVTLMGRTPGVGAGVTAASASYTFQVFIARVPRISAAVKSTSTSAINR